MFALDYLGGAKFKDVILREHPAGWGAGFFQSEFGDAMPVMQELLATGRCPRVRSHLVYEANHTYNPKKHDPIIIAGTEKLNALKKKFPGVDVQVSPFCEHNIKGAQLANLINNVRRVAKGLTIVNSPLTGDKFEGVVNEIHISLSPIRGVYNFSFDGLACVDADVEKFKRAHLNALTFFFWEPRFNGRWESENEPPIDQRKGYPDSRLIDSVIYLSHLKGATSLPQKWIYKSHAENKGTGDPRAEKPAIISPIKANQVELVAANGQVIEALRYYGTYEGGGFRYYSDEWGYQLADKAKRIQNGNPIVRVRAEGKVFGTVNPAFRENDWRNKPPEN
jgi:hypothetical protein